MSWELLGWDELDMTRSAHVFATHQMAMTQALEFNLLLNKSDSHEQMN